jgi:hypothetical protein
LFIGGLTAGFYFVEGSWKTTNLWLVTGSIVRDEFLLKVNNKNITSTNFLLRVLCWVFFIRSSALALLTYKIYHKYSKNYHTYSKKLPSPNFCSATLHGSAPFWEAESGYASK